MSARATSWRTRLGGIAKAYVPWRSAPIDHGATMFSMKATGATAYNILQNNGPGAHQAVFHVHFHIIPKIDESGLGIGWKPGKLADGAELAAAITAAL